MRTFLLQAIEDIASDPSFIEIVTSGPTVSWPDLLTGLISLVIWSAAYRYLARLVLSHARRLFDTAGAP